MRHAWLRTAFRRRLSLRRHKGVTLVELMVAMVIGMFVLAGVMYVFVTSRQTYQYNDAVARLQENGRIALDIISNDVHMAAFSGCRRLGHLSANIRGRELLSAEVRQILEEDLIARDFVDAGPRSVAESDSFSLFGGGGVEPLPLAAAMVDEDSPISLEPALQPFGLEAGDLALITDCEKTDVFQVAGFVGAAVTHGGFERVYNLGSYVIPGFGNWVNYFVRETARTNDAGQTVRALFRQVGGGNAQELVEGVQLMTVRYGLGDEQGFGPVRDYVDAAGVDDWARVISIRVQLLLATVEDNVLLEAQAPFPFGDEGDDDFVPADLRMYQVFSTTMALRNRIK